MQLHCNINAYFIYSAPKPHPKRQAEYEGNPMSDPAVAALLEQVKPLVNRRVGPYIGWNPVIRTQIWPWCMPLGDQNPLYLNDEYRNATTDFSSVVAPPSK